MALKYLFYAKRGKNCNTTTLFLASHTATIKMVEADGEILLTEGCFDTFEEAKAWANSQDWEALWAMRRALARKRRRSAAT